MKYIVVFGFIFPYASLCQTADSSLLSKSDLTAFTVALDSLRQEKNIPGLAVAVVKNKKLAWSKGFGSSHFDPEDGEAYQLVTGDTPFWIASVTKTFIGLLFLKLEEQKKISLDDKINEMPGWDSFCNWLAQSGSVFGRNLNCDQPISIRHILNHTVNGVAGTQFLYNPIMYSRLSRYIEHIYGNDVAEAEKGQNTMAKLVEENILRLAGMDRTMSSQWQTEKAPVFFDMAEGYQYGDEGFVRLIRPERHLAGGAGIVSTVNDLAKYDIALDEGKLASTQVMEKLFTPAVSPEGTRLPYAFGWYVQEYEGEKLIWHAGWDEEAGFSALYLKIPERELTLILLANSEGMWWENPLDKATVEESPFAQVFMERFVFAEQEDQH